MNTGIIIVHQSVGGFGDKTYEFELKGDVFSLDPYEFPILNRKLKAGDRFSLGGVSLIVAEIDSISRKIKAIRDASWKWRLYFFVLDPTINFIRKVYGRMILTLAVWNLAEYQQGEIPGFHCIVKRWRWK